MLPRPESIDDAWRLVSRLPSTCRVGDLPGTVAYVPGNKGFAGRFLESAIGLPASALDGPDFVDGDLKSYAARADGTSIYPVQVAQVTSANVDELVLPAALPFAESRVFRKLQRILLVGIDHVDPDDQRASVIRTRALVDARPGTWWFAELEASYERVVALFNESLRVGREAMGAKATVRHGRLAAKWLHLRGKDSQPYTPVWSDFLEDEISDRQLGFYLEQAFVEAVLSGAGGAIVLR